MANKIFEEILQEEIKKFTHAFSNVSKNIFTNDSDRLFHSGEFGMYREAITRHFLKSFTPANLGIDQGFIINSNNQISTQSDIVIFNNQFTPLLKNDELQRFFPVETVCAVGEVKSNISFLEFKKALHKLANTKAISEYVKNPSVLYRNTPGDFSPTKNPFDLICTFLICQKLEFDINKIEEVYDSQLVRHRHNMILSLEDGLLIYDWGDGINRSGMNFLPTIDGQRQEKFCIYSAKHGLNDCVKIFCNFLFQALCSKTILLTQISDYMAYPEKNA